VPWDAKNVVCRGLTSLNSPRAQCPPLAPIRESHGEPEDLLVRAPNSSGSSVRFPADQGGCLGIFVNMPRRNAELEQDLELDEAEIMLAAANSA